MRKKIRVALLFGGKSAEHEVSLQSAKNILDALDTKKYDVVLIGIDKNGRWYLNDSSHFLLNAQNPKLIALNTKSSREIVSISDEKQTGKIDVVFPVLHGPYGEDGTIQGLLKLAQIPYVGSGVLGSAVGMDKDVMKRLLREAGLPVTKFLVFTKEEKDGIRFTDLQRKLGIPFFVKPANLGSSVGIHKVSNIQKFKQALNDAFQYDNKILIEKYIKGRELECSVLGNENPIASLPGEVIPTHEFYSYEAKYIDPNGAILKAPADLPKDMIHKVQETAVNAFKTLCCEGMARVDFFLSEENKLYVNELNTIPGFTNISMYPKLWEASGIPYSELIDRLIQLGIERFERDQKLKTRVED